MEETTVTDCNASPQRCCAGIDAWLDPEADECGKILAGGGWPVCSGSLSVTTLFAYDDWPSASPSGPSAETSPGEISP